LGACCRPDCPMMAMSNVGKAESADYDRAGAANRCQPTLQSPMALAVPKTSVKLPAMEGRSEIIADPQPRLTLVGNVHAVLRSEYAIQRPRSSLCIFLI